MICGELSKMPRRLLAEPHLLAHELRTPLAILSGWHSLVRDGDVRPGSDRWLTAMRAMDEAATRLNVLIAEACDEVEALERLNDPDTGRLIALVEKSAAAIQHSREVLGRVQTVRRSRRR